MKSIAIFASGSGTNAENLIRYFRTKAAARVELVLSNRPGAGVLERAGNLGVETMVFDRDTFYRTSLIPDLLQSKGIDFVVLAGFLWLIPDRLLEAYGERMVNIHPALLPGYGGKGMYGEAVHRAVIENGETESGITIHYVNREYDQGNIIFQARCEVKSGDSPAALASRIHELEYAHFPVVVERLLDQL